MSILFVDTYYDYYLKNLYSNNISLKNLAYREQLSTLLSSKFGISDSYSRNFKKKGFVAYDIIANCVPLQLKWAEENNFNVPFYSKIINPKLSKIVDLDFLPNINDILFEQIKKIKPQILYIHDINYFSPMFINKVKKITKFIVGQIASPLPSSKFLQGYDLILSSLPNIVKEINNNGINSRFFPLGFDESVLPLTSKKNKIYDVSFIGGYTKNHKKSAQLIEYLAANCNINLWGYGLTSFRINNKISKCFHGEAWGLDMYNIIAQSKILLNRHLDISASYCNNMRLFEVTGMGSLLLTDSKENLPYYFDVGREVMSYNSKEECLEKINFLLSQPGLLKKISLKGQKRTLQNHSYANRIDQLSEILNDFINVSFE